LLFQHWLLLLPQRRQQAHLDALGEEEEKMTAEE